MICWTSMIIQISCSNPYQEQWAHIYHHYFHIQSFHHILVTPLHRKKSHTRWYVLVPYVKIVLLLEDKNSIYSILSLYLPLPIPLSLKRINNMTMQIILAVHTIKVRILLQNKHLKCCRTSWHTGNCFKGMVPNDLGYGNWQIKFPFSIATCCGTLRSMIKKEKFSHSNCATDCIYLRQSTIDLRNASVKIHWNGDKIFPLTMSKVVT